MLDWSELEEKNNYARLLNSKIEVMKEVKQGELSEENAGYVESITTHKKYLDEAHRRYLRKQWAFIAASLRSCNRLLAVVRPNLRREYVRRERF